MWLMFYLCLGCYYAGPGWCWSVTVTALAVVGGGWGWPLSWWGSSQTEYRDWWQHYLSWSFPQPTRQAAAAVTYYTPHLPAPTTTQIAAMAGPNIHYSTQDLHPAHCLSIDCQPAGGAQDHRKLSGLGPSVYHGVLSGEAETAWVLPVLRVPYYQPPPPPPQSSTTSIPSIEKSQCRDRVVHFPTNSLYCWYLPVKV